MTENNRLYRYQGRAALRTVTTVSRCYDCGRQSHMTDGAIGIRQTAEAVGFSGLTTCGRVWLCPVCNSKVMAKRSLEIGLVLAWAAINDLHVIWGSLTLRHNRFSKLGRLLELERDAWRIVMNSKPWQKSNATARVDHVHGTCDRDCERVYDTILTERDGRVGYIRAAELTLGANGWHPHFHPIILFRGTVEAAARLAREVVTAWVAGVTRLGGEALESGAQQLRVLGVDEVTSELANYVTKSTYDASTLSLEAVWSQSKIGRGRPKETQAHWVLLAAIAQGLADEAGRWEELESATFGHRMITWSRGLRAFAGLGREKEDDELAGEEVGTLDDTVAVITPAGWRHVRDTPEALAAILGSLESRGFDAMVDVLDEWGVEWSTIEDLAPSNAV